MRFMEHSGLTVTAMALRHNISTLWWRKPCRRVYVWVALWVDLGGKVQTNN